MEQPLAKTKVRETEPLFIEVELRNTVLKDLPPVKAMARFVPGIIDMRIPQHISERLRLLHGAVFDLELDNGQPVRVPCATQMQVSLAGTVAYGGALVMGDEILLSEHSFSGMRLEADYAHRRVKVVEVPLFLPTVFVDDEDAAPPTKP